MPCSVVSQPSLSRICSRRSRRRARASRAELRRAHPLHRLLPEPYVGTGAEHARDRVPEEVPSQARGTRRGSDASGRSAITQRMGGWEMAYTRMYVNKMLLCQCAHTTHKRPKNHCDGNAFIPLLYTPSLPDVYAKQMVGCMPLSHSTSTETVMIVLCDLDAPHTCRSKGVFGMFPAQPCPALMASTAK